MINQIPSATFNQLVDPNRDRALGKLPDQSSNNSSENKTSLSNESAQRILNEKIVDKLDKVLQKNQSDGIRTLNKNDYTPSAVATRILAFVQEAVDRASSRGGNTSEVIEQAKEGIKKGFKDAENILKSLNALSGEIAEGVQKTYHEIQNGIKKIANGEQFMPVESHSFSTANSQSKSLDLQIKTNDGDIVTITLSESSYQKQSSKSNNGESFDKSVSSESNSEFTLSVEGKLDKEELAAIEKLLSDVKTVTNEFYQGDTNAAFKAGLKLGFESEELTSFSLALNQTQTISQTQAYQEVSNFNNQTPSNYSPAEMSNLLNPIKSFLHSLESTINNANENHLFSESKQDIGKLFNFFSQNDDTNRSSQAEFESLSGTSLEKITNDLISKAV